MIADLWWLGLIIWWGRHFQPFFLGLFSSSLPFLSWFWCGGNSSLCLSPGSATELSGQVNSFMSLSFLLWTMGKSLRWDHCKMERFSHAPAPGYALITDPCRLQGSLQATVLQLCLLPHCVPHTWTAAARHKARRPVLRTGLGVWTSKQDRLPTYPDFLCSLRPSWSFLGTSVPGF